MQVVTLQSDELNAYVVEPGITNIVIPRLTKPIIVFIPGDIEGRIVIEKLDPAYSVTVRTLEPAEEELIVIKDQTGNLVLQSMGNRWEIINRINN